MDQYNRNKALMAPVFEAMKDFTEIRVREQLHAVLAENASVHLAHPMGDLTGPTSVLRCGLCALV